VQAPRRATGIPTGIDLEQLLRLMVPAAREAAEYVRQRAADLPSLAWTAKSHADFVSDVDTGAEDILRTRLLADPVRRAWGDHGVDLRFVGEESSPEETLGAGSAFVVDPLDGTTNFLHGFPWCAVSIGALLGGVPVAGVIVNVFTGELFSAALGRGAFRDGHHVAVSTITEPHRALIGTGFPFKRPEQIAPYVRALPALFSKVAGVRRAGAAALDLADVACGRFEAFWELSLAPWDVAAGLLLVREAGGVVTDVAGRDAPVAHGAIVAGNPIMHAWLLAVLTREMEGGARREE
jgi:myo-inositol-1(or 4)-monophosphatase